MSSKLAEFRAAELLLAKQVALVEALRNDEDLRKEIEFSDALDTLLDKFKMSRQRLIGILQQEQDPKAAVKKAGNSLSRKSPEFKPKTFRNPHTGEEIIVRLRTHGTYKEWVGKYGKEAVESWIIDGE